jgi:predicted CXXCH cytochrome family protein
MFKINRVSLTVAVVAAFWFVAIPHSTWAAKTCYDCHKKAQTEFSARKFIHDPVKKVECESCHKRHGFANKLLLVDNSAQLCYSCHPDAKEKFASGKVHYPVEKGFCWDCHDPHSSDSKGLIRKGQEGVDDPSGCLSCHGEGIAAVGKSKFKHKPYESMACVSCHDPHNSPQVALLKDTPAALCGACHKTDDKKFKQSHEGKLTVGVGCADCHTGHSSDNKGLISSHAHAPYADGSCDACHSLPGTDGKVTFAAGVTAGSVCGDCHSDQAEGPGKAFPHPAVEAANCDNCHDGHSAPYGKLLKKAEGEICRECHGDIASDTTLPVHAPVALNACGSCHEVHGSNTEHLLRKSASQLCLDCHQDYVQLRDSASVVHAGAEDCLQCHDPHQGKQASLLKDTGKELCRACHAIDDKALVSASSHLPYTDGNCSLCHSPHFSRTKHLLREEGSKLCLSCHDDVSQRLGMTTVHPPAQEDCLTCHSPHWSEQKALLSSATGELCVGCHDPGELGINASYVHTPAREGDCTGCHNPHGAMQPKLLSGRARPVTSGGVTMVLSPKLGPARGDLCFVCHETLQEKFMTGQTHPPVTKGECDVCHAAHGSDHRAFVKDTQAALCGGCHTIDSTLIAKHGSYDLAGVNCTDCHSPHVSSKPKLLRANLHPPFEEKSCDNCHTPGPNGKPVLTGQVSEMCGTCHDTVATEMAKPVRHAPFESGDCTGCHSPHASDFGSMLRIDGNDLCFSCHSDLKDLKKAASTHPPFMNGKCLDCHSPHASQYEKLLNKPAEGFCLSCHTGLKDQMAQGLVHSPAKAGKCLACHVPHAGPVKSLLVSERGQLCGKCHDLAGAALTAAHRGFDMTTANCQSCHAAHVASKTSKGLMLPKAHAPFDARNCEKCHQPTGKRELIAPVRTLCLTCHAKVEPSFNKAVKHPPAAEENGCVKCHAPHAGFTSNLMNKDGVATCLGCHDGREFKGEYKHKVTFEGCDNCHQVHSADYKGLLSTPDINGLCMTCHEDAETTHYHPLKDKIDPRTRQPMTCVSCHSPHSADDKSLLRGDKSRGLCIGCHDPSGH